MIDEMYLKELHRGDGDSQIIVSFEGDMDDINELRDYAKIINDIHVDDDWTVENVEEEDIGEGIGDMVYAPSHYRATEIETIEKIETVIDGLPAREAYLLGSIMKYCDRAGLKDNAEQDLRKANNFAHRLIRGKWRNE